MLESERTGLFDPQAIAISPGGQDVYVAAEFDEDIGDVAEFTRNADGTLTPISGNDCLAEQGSDECNAGSADNNNADGLEFPDALAVSPDGNNVYVADRDAEAVTALTRSSLDGSLSEPGGPADCIQDQNEGDSGQCSNEGTGISEVMGVAVSPDGDNVYTTGDLSEFSNASIAEFSRGAGGTLTSWPIRITASALRKTATTRVVAARRPG